MSKNLLNKSLILSIVLLHGCATYQPAPQPKGTPFPINTPSTLEKIKGI